jgi:hypothetical protein
MQQHAAAAFLGYAATTDLNAWLEIEPAWAARARFS